MPKNVKKSDQITVQFVGGNRDGQVSRIDWSEAQNLIDTGKAISISRSLYKAAKFGIDIRSIRGEDRRNDALIKGKINDQRSKNTERQKKKESARQKIRSETKNG